MVEFRILGSLEVSDGDRPLPVNGPRQRALLAMLLLHANEVVPTDRLLEALWGDRLPDSGPTALQVRVSQLRKALGRARSSGIVLTRPPGYVLEVGPEAIDARRFERLLLVGRAELADQEPERAAATLGAALALWRGPALAEFTYEPFAQPEIARLEELRLVAVEERGDAELACGRHEGLVAELEALVAEHPLRERLRRQLMLGLYRSGRQADALDAYRDARRALVDGLGIEPGEELRRLEQAILRQDPALAAPRQPSPRPSPSLRPVAEERKVVSVLFADLADSTALTSSLDPERARAVLERYYDAMAEQIEAAEGTVEKFIGDAVMAVFGAPVAQEDHPERALHTALALCRRLAQLHGDELELCVGVATGEVVVGRQRHGSSFVTGLVVNTAERLQRGAAPGQILVDERTARAVRGAFELGPAMRVDAKGMPDGVHARSLVRALAHTRPRGLHNVEPVFVGRGRELELLCATYRRVVAEGRPALVTVVGDAGVGKSRLVQELWNALAEESPAPRRRTGRCRSYGAGITYRPLGDILLEELGLLASDPPALVRSRLGGRELLAASLGLDVSRELHPLAVPEQQQQEWVAFVEKLVAEGPAVFLVEDLHWAHEPLLQLLAGLVRSVRGPLLLVATARPELLDLQQEWGRGLRDASTVWLEPLSPDDTELLVEELLAAEVPEPVRDLLLQRAEGNPFYVEELLAGLVDERVVVRDEDGWVVHDLPRGLRPPQSVQAVLASRIDLLPTPEKEALQAAAVIGRVFWRGAVQALTGTDTDFALLEARDFVRRRTPSSVEGETELAFKHALTREVAYESIPKALRARLHAGFGAWLEQAAPARDDVVPVLAHHYAEAVDPRDVDLAWVDDAETYERLRASAVRWLRRAAELATGRYELDDATALLERALALADGTERCELFLRLGRTCALKFDAQAFLRAMREAMACTADDTVRAEYAAELAYETFMRSGMWATPPPREELEDAIGLALDHAASASAARAKALVARSFAIVQRATPLARDDIAAGEESAREAWAIAERLDDAGLRACALDALQTVATASWDYARAFEHGLRRLELLEAIDDPDVQADLVQSLAPAAVAIGDFERARDLARLNDDITRSLTPHHRVHGVSTLVAVEEALGGWDAIRALRERVREVVGANLDTPCTNNARALLQCALAEVRLGSDSLARELEAEANAVYHHEAPYVVDAARLRLALARGNLGRAEELLASLLRARWWYQRQHNSHPAALTTQIDALALLGRSDLVEQRAPWMVQAGAYFAPFGRRALGLVRRDASLVEAAGAEFARLGLDWHASETHDLLDWLR
jgi:DNA-binding SARP family transcriptional activator